MTKTARWIAAGLLAGLLLPGAASAGSASGAGTLEDVDADAGTVTVGRNTLALASWSRLFDASGRSLSLHDLDEADDAWVTYSARPAEPHPLIQRLTLEDGSD